MRDNYKKLDSEKVEDTIRKLSERIAQRFPGSGLSNVAVELLHIVEVTKETATWISRPNVPLRVGICLLLGLIGAGLVTTVVSLEAPTGGVKLVEFIHILEAGINDVVLIGAAVFFLSTLENRLKRGRALKAIHELRAISHIIDMHQLTKDPQKIFHKQVLTLSSPKHEMTAYELGRYLDYCSELLSLTGKISALYVQDFDDPVALAAVNEVEELTTGLSRKIWQKLMILSRAQE